jgi:hypothetical protein
MAPSPRRRPIFRRRRRWRPIIEGGVLALGLCIALLALASTVSELSR